MLMTLTESNEVMVKMRAPGKYDEKFYHGFVWGASAILTIIPVFTGSYGRKGLKSYWYAFIVSSRG